MCLISILALYRFEHSRIGTDLKAIAQSHLVASSVGINEGWYRVLALGFGCFFAGLAGAGYAHYNLVLSPNIFDMSGTFNLFMYALVGGINSFYGPIAGTFILLMIPEYFRGLKAFNPFIGAGIVLLVAYLLPSGFVSIPGIVSSWFREKIKNRKKEKISNASGN